MFLQPHLKIHVICKRQKCDSRQYSNRATIPTRRDTHSDGRRAGELEQLSNSLEDETFFSGECIVREGETGDAFYIVQSGAVSVHIRRTTSASGEMDAAMLSAGGGPAEGRDSGIGPSVTVLK